MQMSLAQGVQLVRELLTSIQNIELPLCETNKSKKCILLSLKIRMKKIRQKINRRENKTYFLYLAST